MKRTAAAFVLVAGLGGCASPDGSKPSAISDTQAIRGQTPREGGSGVKQATAYRPAGSTTDPSIRRVNYNGGYPPEVYGPRNFSAGLALGHGGIMPAPHMGPPGAVAGIGFGGPNGGMGGPQFANQRTQIRFVQPGGMTVHFMDASGGFNGPGRETPLKAADAGRETPMRYPFLQGNIYRLKLANIKNRPGKAFYPTIEVYPTTEKTVEFLSHTSVPLAFTDEDFDQVNVGNLVVKVIYLPDASFQDMAVAEELVSTKLEPGVDPIQEAKRRGTILLVVRLGNIDLEDTSAPPVNDPGMGMPGPGGPRMAPPMMAPPAGGPAPMGAGTPRGTGMPARPTVGDVGVKMPTSLPPLNVPALPK